MKKQKGQTILILVLIMTVALAIGLSTVQRSLSDISTSSKVEQSSRAFSAAEAGIERALQVGSTTIQLENQSSAQVLDSSLIPAIPSSTPPTRQDPLEYPPLSKEEVAHVWLANYNSTTPSSPANCGPNIACHYIQNTLDVFWGNNLTDDKAALELTLVYFDGTKYTTRKWYLDQVIRSPENNFDTSANCSNNQQPDSGVVTYQCKITLRFSAQEAAGQTLMRVRLLYNTTSQSFAVQAAGNCGLACSIPPQARILISTGVAGETQRKVKLFQINKVVPPYFDYAIFSAGEISK